MILVQNRRQPLNGNNMIRILYITIITLIVFSCASTAQVQDGFQTHQVKEGETIYSIAKQYNITESTIYRLNPNAKNGISVENILIIPFTVPSKEIQEEVEFKTHRVKRKETLFSIAQRYNVKEDDIRRYNKELYSRQLKKGERIKIPIIVEKPEPVISTSDNMFNDKHIVAAKETKYGIARKYGVTVAELENLNPTLGDTLKIGDILMVPRQSVVESAIIEDEKYDFYEVLPKEGFFRLKVKYGLSEAEIIELNPYAKDGLKEGMILKIPKESFGRVNIVDLEDHIVNTTKKNIALMLPFRAYRSEKDSLESNKELLRSDATLRIALDFYSGVLMAAEFAKDLGISVNIDVYDTEADVSKVNAIIAQNDFEKIDAVIGPLLRKNVEMAASELKRTNTPIFSPLSNKEIKISSNLFQTLPTDEMLGKAMLEYLKVNSKGKNVILISDEKKNSSKTTIVSTLNNVRTISPQSKGYLVQDDILPQIVETMDNWVILESADPVLVSNVIGLLNGIPEEFNIRLFTLDKNIAYDYHDVSNVHLAKLDFTFPSVNKSHNYKEKIPFFVSYQNKYGVLPNRYAIRGFDVAYDILLRLASADDIYDATETNMETEYVENKFQYTKTLFSGYQNHALYIIKYNHELQFEEVK